MPVELTCKNCNSSYSVKPSREGDSKFCSVSCKSEYSRVSVTCDECGDRFSKYKRRAERSDADLCSESCRQKYWSENYRPELSQSGKSITLTCNQCDSEFEKPQSQRSYEKSFCNSSCYGNWISDNLTGENHPRWNENSEQIYYGPNWYKQRRRVVERDDGCVRCGMTVYEHLEEYGFEPDVHHITPVDKFDNFEKANDERNLITLCRECHRSVETGKANVIDFIDNMENIDGMIREIEAVEPAR